MSEAQSDKRLPQEERVAKAIFSAVDQVNQTLPREHRLEKSTVAPLMGHLDSLAMVNFIVAAEEQIAKEFGVSVNLADEKAMSQVRNPFQTVQSLIHYVSLLLFGEVP